MSHKFSNETTSRVATQNIQNYRTGTNQTRIKCFASSLLLHRYGVRRVLLLRYIPYRVPVLFVVCSLPRSSSVIPTQTRVCAARQQRTTSVIAVVFRVFCTPYLYKHTFNSQREREKTTDSNPYSVIWNVGKSLS